MAREKILIIEDDEDIQELISHNLNKEGMIVTVCGTGEDGLDKVKKDPFDCILLDLMLPGMDGLDVCRFLKKNSKTQDVPIIMISAKGEESDIVTGLELGADDYIVKPFSPKILIARIRLIFRKNARMLYKTDEVLHIKNMEINPGRHEVVYDGKHVDLTHMEFQVLHLLASQPGWVFTRNQIIDHVQIDNYSVTERSVDVVIVGLRKKLGDAGEFIETVRGVGYKFSDQ